MGMEFSKPITGIIEQRTSKRTYTPDTVEEEKLKKIEDFFASIEGPFGVATRFGYVETDEFARDGKINALGTYGTIKGATRFIVGATDRADRDMQNFGYVFEKIILLATDLGLGTCWIGGIFNRSSFADKIRIEDHEVVPAITPIGYTTKRRSITDSVIRWSAGSKSRKPWPALFLHENFETSLSDQAAGKYERPLEMLRLGPSASNRQPWRVVKERGKDTFHLYLRRSKGYDKLVKAVDLQRIDMGIAMCHFELTARELGLGGSWVVDEPSIGPLPERFFYSVTWAGE